MVGCKQITINVRGISTVGSALHSHCRGHRFESGMLHSRTCRNAGPFSYIEENMQESCCKSCKIDTPFRDVPQFIPQLMPANPGKSKKSVHFCDLFLLGFHAGMGIKLECQRNFGVPQDFRERPHIHPRLHRSGGKGVPQGMNAHGVKPCLLEGAMENAVQIPSFIRRTNRGAEYQIIGIPFIPCRKAGYKLFPPLNEQ